MSRSTATEWAAAATDALLFGLRKVLPWGRFGLTAAPIIVGREQEVLSGVAFEAPPGELRLILRSPVDVAGGRNNVSVGPASLVSRLLRRVDGLARWQGLALDPEVGRGLALLRRSLDFGTDHLIPGHYDSPNRHGQSRRHPTLTGHLDIAGNLAPIWPILRIGTRCHMGRGAVEGLGRFQLEPSAH